jgi:hypothetical protein
VSALAMGARAIVAAPIAANKGATYFIVFMMFF